MDWLLTTSCWCAITSTRSQGCSVRLGVHRLVVACHRPKADNTVRAPLSAPLSGIIAITAVSTTDRRWACETQIAGINWCARGGRGRGSIPMKGNKPVIQSDPEVMGGTPVFIGTRVPLEALFDYLKAGQPLAEFFEDFPTVTKEQALAAIEQRDRS